MVAAPDIFPQKLPLQPTGTKTLTRKPNTMSYVREETKFP